VVQRHSRETRRRNSKGAEEERVYGVPLLSVLPHCSLFVVQSHSRFGRVSMLQREPSDNPAMKKRVDKEIDIVVLTPCGAQRPAVFVGLLFLC
jgi:hypothetical protein